MQKCRYCDFVSYAGRLEETEAYISALMQEMEEYSGLNLDTVYLGGGTPTALAPAQLSQVLSAVRRSFSLTENCEITVEANPGTVSAETFSVLAESGVNRVSLGAQSFVNSELKSLGRIHTSKEAEEAVLAARQAGIQNVSLDLMFSIPNQTEKTLTESLNRAVSLSPEHLSCYSLMLCEGTPMYEDHLTGKLSLPDEDEDRRRDAFITEFLEKNGYERYEISNFAKPGQESRHNTKYWTRAPYIGLGAGAHSFFEGERFENPSDFSGYYERVSSGRHPKGEAISEKDAMAEFMFLGLRRTKAGVLRRDFQASFGKTLEEVYEVPLKKLISLALLEDDGQRIRLTKRGIDVSNGVFCEFL